ncbi:MAG: hypothetical protein EBV06_04475 [Planctomycetia bacterium]|nr:hypothetical protein [Planctomycetia bacterium]
MSYLIFALMLIAPHAAPPSSDHPLHFDEALLKAGKINLDGPSLMVFLRSRYTEITDERIKQLVEQMGDESWYVREDATVRLTTIGLRARRFLEAARKHDDLEIRYRARRCLEDAQSGGRDALELAAAAVRQLARLKPDGAVAVLLECIESAEDDMVGGEMKVALSTIGVRAGQPDPLIVAALKSRSVRAKSAAVTVICQNRVKEHYDAVEKCFADESGPVRFAAAIGLIEAGQKEAVKALIAETDRPLSRETSLAEDLLLRLAGDRAPVPSGTDETARKNYRKAWEAWWKEQGEKVDLEVAIEYARIAGFTTVVLLDRDEIIDLDASNRVRFRITGLGMPLDVQRLPKDRVLVAEHNAGRVTERDSKGDIVWEHRVSSPLSAQRLPNGNTFIATREGLIEVNPKGVTVWEYNRPSGEQIMRARRLPGGDNLMVTTLGVARFVRVDRNGRDVAGFGVEVYTSGGRVDLTPAGNVLIPELHNRRVVERKMDGTIVREIKVEQPITALVLPGGNILITSMTEKRAFEVDREGKEVWEYRRETRVTRAVRP